MDIPPADRALVTETLHRYCDLVDRADLDAVLTLFEMDASVDMGPHAVVTGHAQLRALMTDRLGRWTSTCHQCTTLSITAYDGLSVETTSCIDVLHDDPAHGRALHLWGRYVDRLRKADGVWRFTGRRLLVAAAHETASGPLPARFTPVPRRPLPARSAPDYTGLPVA